VIPPRCAYQTLRAELYQKLEPDGFLSLSSLLFVWATWSDPPPI
jgi:hypothetical protein